MHVWVQVPLPAPFLDSGFYAAIFLYNFIRRMILVKNILKLSPCHVDKVWGYEKWILSTHRNGYSYIEGEDKILFEYINKELSILIKEIMANDSLSVQVHPGDDYAKEKENDLGKTECWYILDAKENATLICGLKEGVTKEEFKSSLEDNTVERLLNRIHIKKGDMIYIPSGTVHAIEGGIKILEIQECSDVTYRVYDWGRDRELHIDKALDVINFDTNISYGKVHDFKNLHTPYFNVDKIDITDVYKDNSKEDYNVYICINGNGKIYESSNKFIEVGNMDVIYIKEGTNYTIEGKLEVLKIYK